MANPEQARLLGADGNAGRAILLRDRGRIGVRTVAMVGLSCQGPLPPRMKRVRHLRAGRHAVAGKGRGWWGWCSGEVERFGSGR